MLSRDNADSRATVPSEISATLVPAPSEGKRDLMAWAIDRFDTAKIGLVNPVQQSGGCCW